MISCQLQVQRKADLLLYDGTTLRSEFRLGGEWRRYDPGYGDKVTPIAMPEAEVVCGAVLSYRLDGPDETGIQVGCVSCAEGSAASTNLYNGNLRL